MQKLKLSASGVYLRMLSALLSLLGFATACSDTGCVEYGSPHATFVVKGQITNRTSKAPIPDLKVVVGYDTLYTDETGRYEARNTAPPMDMDFPFTIQDMDGVEHSTFVQKDTLISFTDPAFENPDGNWFFGTATKEVNIKLDPEE